ncbi:unnamed protein product [Rotaria sordida]|uniref:PPPDE domain-containing protein n=1 Tax=Rotaria sordida TaxID=392033 RepID=A0A814K4Q6_9BILA|nr:unnamed protein product [Rotaria sordida]
MHLFLCWREMEDRIGTLGYSIETYLWGDSRARHTFLIACTDEHPLVFIEIDVGNPEKGIHKSMKLNIKELDEIPNTISKIEFIGETSSPIALPHLIKSAYDYVKEHPNYHVLLNNCRTFVEYLIDQMPEFHNSIPRRNGSILEYYHAQAKNEHPGALLRSKRFLKDIHDFHRRNREYKYASLLVLHMELPKLDNDNDVRIIETRL